MPLLILVTPLVLLTSVDEISFHTKLFTKKNNNKLQNIHALFSGVEKTNGFLN